MSSKAINEWENLTREISPVLHTCYWSSSHACRMNCPVFFNSRTFGRAAGEVWPCTALELLSPAASRRSWDFAVLHRWWLSSQGSDAELNPGSTQPPGSSCRPGSCALEKNNVVIYSKQTVQQPHICLSKFYCFSCFFQDILYNCCLSIYFCLTTWNPPESLVVTQNCHMPCKR